MTVKMQMLVSSMNRRPANSMSVPDLTIVRDILSERKMRIDRSQTYASPSHAYEAVLPHLSVLQGLKAGPPVIGIPKGPVEQIPSFA
ncbi:hypothetical protein J2855_004910 [Agrobacterium tumefaciens]|nr:hypothetical protein [Agrobacterium tumefaciens]MBP2520624.1 hypothetical protein [Agrobacterium tumefaciens]MBP2573713.1 hypothetical protein [Agrobacterium tumefaciens]MBP2597579.1 hypothetical protein [Agrobacterium tumefaciens]